MVRGEKPLEPSGSGGFSLCGAFSGSAGLTRWTLTRWIRWNFVLVLVLACVERFRRRR
jgi:hypothetical protein